MGGFTLDTSGFVEGRPEGVRTKRFYWADLDPFTQGYIEALFESNRGLYWAGARADERMSRSFSDLAPEALATILRDCAVAGRDAAGCNLTHDDGEEFWADRQAGKWPTRFPPVDPYLGDDGLIYLRTTPHPQRGDHDG